MLLMLMRMLLMLYSDVQAFDKYGGLPVITNNPLDTTPGGPLCRTT
jgi:hypothetical protein